MDNFYESHMRSIAGKLHEMMVVDGVIKFFHDIYYGNNEEQKKAFAPMMFLADPQYENASEWVRNAIKAFDESEVFATLHNDPMMDAKMKCIFIKAYRTIVKEKRKSKQDISTTHDEVVDRVIAWLKAGESEV